MVYNFFLFFFLLLFSVLGSTHRNKISTICFVRSYTADNAWQYSLLCTSYTLYMSTKGYIYIYVEVVFYIYNKVIRSEIESKYWRFHLSLSQWIFGWMVCYAGLLGWFWMGGVVELLLFSSIQKWTYIYFC